LKALSRLVAADDRFDDVKLDPKSEKRPMTAMTPMTREKH